ncbi:B12-binding domain-containing radical SAM protein [Clostridium intestinale]|uniref:B12-binding domain-containing radical SAM protein n=1 Tax=Clostridium intestinale TaxID=36845 RepID=UPI002DD68922|nr:B12-binding domain-containing radical SAM protein [Clostridium intestinale]WRY51929.1 B12-binding domain-containing radical SAM protein [Clostridium intestinale]
MKILLLAINSQFIHSNLAVRYLRSFTQDLNYEAVIKEVTINDRVENILKEIIKEKPNVVAFSAYIWNLEYVERLTELIKRVDENIEILYGGPEVSYDSEGFFQNNRVDYIISGEGEETYRDFVLYKLGELHLSKIKGLYFKKDGEVYFNGERKLMNMNDIIFPYSDEDNLEDKMVYYEASRGCPFSCKYCLSSTIHGVRFLDTERVKKELQFFMDKKVRLVKFVDRTFNCNHKFVMEIWSFLINSDTKTRFHFEVSADILKDDEIKLLNTAPKGRFQLEVGVQTTNPQILKNINRTITFEDIKEKVVEIKKGDNIHQHLDLIAGLSGEDYESFKKSFNDVYNLGVEMVQLGFLKLLRGSDMRIEAEEWGIEYSPYPPYEVLKTSYINYFELLELKKIDEMVDKYNNSGKFSNILKYLIPKFETPFDFFKELGNFFEEKGYFNRNIGSVEYYKVFLDFYNEKMQDKEERILKEIIKYDYLCFNKKRWLPDFLIREVNKDLEKNIKEAKRNKIIELDYDSYHVEKFSIDIIGFVNNDVIKEEDCYLIFDERDFNNFIDFTKIIKEKDLI